MTTVDNSVSNPGNVHIFGSKAIGFDFEQARVKNTRHSLMTWAGIRHGNQGPHVVLLDDADSKRGGVTSAIYRDHSQGYFPTMFKSYLAHDNVPVYTARIVKTYLEELHRGDSSGLATIQP